MKSLIAFGCLLFTLEFAFAFPQNPATNKQKEDDPKKTQAADNTRKQPSAASANTLDVPKLVVGVMPSESQFKRCEKAIVRAERLKNIDDDTQNRIQVCKNAIAVYDAENGLD